MARNGLIAQFAEFLTLSGTQKKKFKEKSWRQQRNVKQSLDVGDFMVDR